MGSAAAHNAHAVVDHPSAQTVSCAAHAMGKGSAGFYFRALLHTAAAAYAETPQRLHSVAALLCEA